jgi:glycosyltransferase involved in cell wall biosynthesis
LAKVIAVLERGGAQLAVLHTALALRRYGIETRILAGYAAAGGLELFARGGLEVEVWGEDPHLQYECRPHFADWLRPALQDADVVHAHMFGAWWAASRAIGTRTPLMASEHNAVRWPARPRLRAMREALQRVDLFFAHGPPARELVLELGLPHDRLRTGVSPVAGMGARPLPGLPRPRLVYAGRLHPEKGPDLLLDAVARIRRPPPTLVLGSGPLATSLRAAARRSGLAQTVRFLGWREDPARFIAGATACVVPSRHEAWSQTAVLAMGLGVPVVASSVEGLPSTLAQERGILVAPEDPQALAEALEAVRERRRVPDLDGARRYAQRFRPERVVETYMRALRGLASAPVSTKSAA